VANQWGNPGQTVHDSIPVIITKGIVNSPVSAVETTYAQSKALL